MTGLFQRFPSAPNFIHTTLLALVVLFGCAIAAVADERILLFDSQITVNKDGSLIVQETIRVNAEGR
ncbi:MAG: hypothetical protein AAGG69_14460, partial [Pseudomonadota bacterium]